MTVQPLIFREETPRGLRIQATCIAPEKKGNWSLKDVYDQEGADANPELVAAVQQELMHHGSQRTYAPSVAAMSGTIVSREKLSTSIDLGGGFTLYRNRELPADGVPLDPETCDSFMQSGAGCPVIVAYAGKHVVVAHAARDSLIDRNFIVNGVGRREHDGVIQQLVEYLRQCGASVEDIQIRVLFTIRPRIFTHPFTDRVHGEKNKILYEYLKRTYPSIIIMREGGGQFSIPALIAAQAQSFGVPKRNLCSSHLLPLQGDFAHTRKDKYKRNLIIVRVSLV